MTAPGIAVEGLSLAIGTFRLHALDFALSAGEILVILGPNGSGKSVTLETIAGFHRPDAGRVLIRGRDVTRMTPERRNIGFLVQNFGLFPHLTVAQNVAIALRTDRAAAGQAALLPRGGVAGLLGHFGVAHLAQRAPQELSPGEKQRVALARALAAAPDLFLFDEPFSAIDAQTRDQLRDELLSFLRGLSIPAIFVTHDHTDAMTLADKIVVLRDGVMMQTGSAADIFHKPAEAFVARFVGVENVLAGRVGDMRDGFAAVTVGERTLFAAAPSPALGSGTAVQVSIRPECVDLHPPDIERPPQRGANRLKARVTGLRTLGPLTTVQAECGFSLKAYASAQQARELNLRAGVIIDVEIAAESIHLMRD